MRVVLLVIIFCAAVNGDGDCEFHTDESKHLHEKLKKWGVDKKNFTVKTNAATYQIGICIPPNNAVANAAIIQTENNESIVLGQLSLVDLIGEDNWILLTYGNGTRYNNTCFNNARAAAVIFVCGKDMSNITVVQEHTSKTAHCNYVFQIQVPGMCPEVPQVKKKLSGGVIFLIIVLCLASAYLIGGFLFMRIKCGARGIDQIPNLEMWRKIGHLSADGCDFCCRCKSGSPRAGYFIDESGPDFRGDDDILAP